MLFDRKSPNKRIVFFGLAACILLAVAIPKLIYFIERPPTPIEKLQLVKAKWGDIEKRATSGDAEARFRIGTAMTQEGRETETGIGYDPESGVQQIHKLVYENHPEAILWVWKNDGENPESLAQTAREIVDLNPSVSVTGELIGWLQWYGAKSCREDIRSAEEITFAKYEMIFETTQTSAPSDHSLFQEKFLTECTPGS